MQAGRLCHKDRQATTRGHTEGTTPMTMESPKLRLTDAIVLACLLLCAVGLYLATNDVSDVDDAYISYRYAANLAQGNGAVYNPGERVYGSTTLAWVGWLALWSRLTGVSVVGVSWASALVFLIADCMLLYFLVGRLTGSRWLSAAAVLLLLASPEFLLISTLGMETMFYVLLILLSFWCYSFERHFLAGIAAGATFCIRPDGLAVFAALAGTAAIDYLFASRGQPPSARVAGALKSGPARLAIGFLLVALPFALLCYAYYGSVLPHTLQAKRTHPMVSGRWWMLKHFVGNGWPVAVGVVLGTVTLGLKALRKTTSNRIPGVKVTMAAMLWLSLYVVAWTIIRIDMYPWYLAAMGPASVLAVLLPLAVVPLRTLGKPLRVGLCLWLGIVGAFWCYTAYCESILFSVYLHQVELPRHEMAQAINRYTEPGKERIGSGAIGIIGYDCRGHALHDFASLVTPLNILNDPAFQPTLVVAIAPDFPDSKPREPFVIEKQNRKFEYEIVRMCASQTLPAPYGPIYLETWVRLDGASTWDAARCPPARPIGASFGPSVRLVGVNPIRAAVDPGESPRCEVLWQFEKPLGDDARIVYALSRDGAPPVARMETTGFFRNSRPLQRVHAGESVLDFVELPLAAAPPPGRYRLSVALRDQDAIQPDEAHRQPDFPEQVCIMEVEVRGAAGR